MSVVAHEELRIRDAYARRGQPERYSWFDAAHVNSMQEVERGVLRFLRKYSFHPLATQRVLEIGCGTAVWLREFIKWGAVPERLAGVELLDDRVRQATAVTPTGVRLIHGSAATLNFADASFDIVFQFLVFTSILDEGVRARVASEMLRVARPGGLILWYDYHVNNPSNPDVRAVKAREIARLFPGCTIERERITLAPPLARLVAPRWHGAYAVLSSIPLLKTHYLAAVRRPA